MGVGHKKTAVGADEGRFLFLFDSTAHVARVCGRAGLQGAPEALAVTAGRVGRRYGMVVYSGHCACTF